jgi:hypothetical protein
VLSVPLLVDWVCALELPELPEPQPVWVKVKENKAANIPVRNINFAIRYMAPTVKRFCACRCLESEQQL